MLSYLVPLYLHVCIGMHYSGTMSVQKKFTVKWEELQCTLLAINLSVT